MTDFFKTIVEYMQFPFVRYAIITGVLIALSSSLLGVILVLKRFSYIGDGLSHVAFGAMALASVMGIAKNDMLLILPITIFCAVLLLKGGENRKIKGDAAIAMISVGSLALGYLFLNIFKPSSNLSGDVCTTLFGSTSILTLTPTEVWVSVILSLASVVFFVLFYNKLFAITFDETFAKANGIKTDLYNTLLAIVIAVIIVLAMKLVGSLLISALVIFPAMSAMRIFKSFKKVTVASVIFSIVCSFFGMMISIVAGTPVGATIVGLDIVLFAVCSLIATLQNHSFRKVGAHACLFLILAASLASPFYGQQKVDMDLSKFNYNMLSAQIFNIMMNTGRYEGQTVRISGEFMTFVNDDEGPDARDFSCITMDATRCCATGLDFELAGNPQYPKDYPPEDSIITVEGTLHTFEQDGISYTKLINSHFVN
ncbi:MAG: metal ABC transporter permease [Treponemataceae bacterium]|nr:metal ABC transporter permease [Treponemataceae bacterium]